MTKASPDDFVAGAVSDFPAGKHSVVKIGKLEVGVFNVNGKLYALRNICPHQFGPLCVGPVNGEMICNEETDWRFHWQRDGEIVTCPWHGLEFDITTGQCLASKRLRVRQYPVEVADGQVVVILRSGSGRPPES